jgi:hypothetical protein
MPVPYLPLLVLQIPLLWGGAPPPGGIETQNN